MTSQMAAHAEVAAEKSEALRVENARLSEENKLLRAEVERLKHRLKYSVPYEPVRLL